MNENIENYTILAHYTDFKAFEGIIANGEIWLNNCKYMSDEKEIMYFLDSLMQETCDQLSDIEQQLVKKEFNKQMKDRENDTSYVMCFSRNIDDAAQWDRYARNGTGICIEFNMASLKKLFENYLDISEVWYISKGFSKAHRELLIDWARDKEHKVGQGLDDEKGLFDSIWQKAILYKHPAYATENEIRIATLTTSSEHRIINVDNINAFSGLKYCITNGGLKEFVAVKWIELAQKNEIEITDLIHRILIGPKSSTDVLMLQRYLKSIKRDCLIGKVEKSTYPLR